MNIALYINITIIYNFWFFSISVVHKADFMNLDNEEDFIISVFSFNELSIGLF